MSDKTIEPTLDDAFAGQDIDAVSTAGATTAFPRGPGAIRTVILMARLTFLEAVRRRILWIAAIAGAAFLGMFWAGLHSVLLSMSPKVPPGNRLEGIGIVTMMTLYAGS